jgi:acetyl esterase/lipase
MVALLAATRAPANILNSMTDETEYTATRSIAYDKNARQTLDVYQPAGAADAPVIIFLYGGNWQGLGGNKDTYLFLAAALAGRGYVIIVPDYRSYPEVKYPKFIEDGAQAVRWAKDNASRFGGSPDKIFVMGHSAGAYIAAMLAIDSEWLRAVNLDPHRDIAGLIGVSGPYDFLPLRNNTLKVIFGGANVPATQPISHVSRGAPPSLLLTGANDKAVDPRNVTRLAARLRAHGNSVKAITYPRIHHFTIIGSFAPALRFLAPVLQDVDAFVAETASAKRGALLPHEAATAQ